MRSGPLVHRSSNVSRAGRGAPSSLVRLTSLPLFTAQSHDRSPRAVESGAALWRSNGVQLGARLPINLRHFLATELGETLRVEDDAIIALRARPDEVLMREFARAIRRFSARRARETWTECSVALERLERELAIASAAAHHPAILCMRCVALNFGHGARERHSAHNCLTVDLNRAGSAGDGNPMAPNRSPVDGLLRVIEEFRQRREGAGEPHYDLDCYTASRQVVFTWRPMPLEHAV